MQGLLDDKGHALFSYKSCKFIGCVQLRDEERISFTSQTAREALGCSPSLSPGCNTDNAVKIASLLMRRGGDLDLRDEEGCRALQVVSERAAMGSARLLLNQGAALGLLSVVAGLLEKKKC